MIQKRLDDAEKLIAETGQQIRGLMAELRPAVLDDYGLLAALRWYSEYFSQRTAIHTTVVSVDPIQRLASSDAGNYAVSDCARGAHQCRQTRPCQCGDHYVADERICCFAHDC